MEYASLGPLINRALCSTCSVLQMNTMPLYTIWNEKHSFVFISGMFLPLKEFKAVRRKAAELFIERNRQAATSDGLAQSPVLPELLAAARQLPSDPEARKLAGAEAETSGRVAEDMSDIGIRYSPGSSQFKHGFCLRVLCRTKQQVGASRDTVL